MSMSTFFMHRPCLLRPYCDKGHPAPLAAWTGFRPTLKGERHTPLVYHSFLYRDLCLEHEVGDFDLIPDDVQLKIRDFAEETCIPDVLDYLGTKHPILK